MCGGKESQRSSELSLPWNSGALLEDSNKPIIALTRKDVPGVAQILKTKTRQ